jgi:hypothetical protein
LASGIWSVFALVSIVAVPELPLVETLFTVPLPTALNAAALV